MKLAAEDLRSDLIDLVEKYAKPMYELDLNEDEIVEIADEIMVSFGGYFDDHNNYKIYKKLVAENRKLRSSLEKLRQKNCKNKKKH